MCHCALPPQRITTRLMGPGPALAGLLPVLALAAEPAPAPLPNSAPATAQVATASGIRIHALRTGWVAVKSTHRELDVPRWLALPSIFLGQTWAAWMPIITFAIEHPEGVILVDTGPSPQINDADYYACDKHNEFFYKRNMRFSVPAGDTLEPRLAQVGIDPAKVRSLVITHFHADHIGGVNLVPQAKAYTGAGNWPNHTGAFTCRLPAGFAPTMVSFNSTAAGITQSTALTADGKVRIVPLPGHTPGHVGVTVTDGGKTWLMAGDATFDQDQTDRGAVTGVSQSITTAIATQAALKSATAKGEITMLPAHDPTVFSRLWAR
jgi:N-acyl homoserine lactone hydrolase